MTSFLFISPMKNSPTKPKNIQTLQDVIRIEQQSLLLQNHYRSTLIQSIERLESFLDNQHANNHLFHQTLNTLNSFLTDTLDSLQNLANTLSIDLTNSITSNWDANILSIQNLLLSQGYVCASDLIMKAELLRFMKYKCKSKSDEKTINELTESFKRYCCQNMENLENLQLIFDQINESESFLNHLKKLVIVNLDNLEKKNWATDKEILTSLSNCFCDISDTCTKSSGVLNKLPYDDKVDICNVIVVKAVEMNFKNLSKTEVPVEIALDVIVVLTESLEKLRTSMPQDYSIDRTKIWKHCLEKAYCLEPIYVKIKKLLTETFESVTLNKPELIPVGKTPLEIVNNLEHEFSEYLHSLISRGLSVISKADNQTQVIPCSLMCMFFIHKVDMAIMHYWRHWNDFTKSMLDEMYKKIDNLKETSADKLKYPDINIIKPLCLLLEISQNLYSADLNNASDQIKHIIKNTIESKSLYNSFATFLIPFHIEESSIYNNNLEPAFSLPKAREELTHVTASAKTVLLKCIAYPVYQILTDYDNYLEQAVTQNYKDEPSHYVIQISEYLLALVPEIMESFQERSFSYLEEVAKNIIRDYSLRIMKYENFTLNGAEIIITDVNYLINAFRLLNCKTDILENLLNICHFEKTDFCDQFGGQKLKTFIEKNLIT